MRAAFGGYLGKEMKSKAKSWANETPNPKKLPAHVKGSKAKFSGAGTRARLNTAAQKNFFGSRSSMK